MKKIYSVALAMIAVLLSMPTVWAAKHRADEKPIVTIYTDVYKIVGPSNSNQIRLGTDLSNDYFTIDYGSGPEEIEVEPWGVVDGAIKATNISVTVGPQDVIKIYGNAENLAYLDIEGLHATEIEMSACTKLQAIDFSHNDLKSLDLTPFTELVSIYLTSNPFTAETPLKVGAPKNNLTILELDIIEHLDQSFNLSDYPNVVLFDAYANHDLWKLDTSGCPNLGYLTLDMTNVETLDLSKNPLLKSLDISNTRISEIDLSHNPQLSTFLVDHSSSFVNPGYTIKSIDVTNNPEITILSANHNNLSEIDLTKNTKLTNLSLSWNNLEELDLSKNTSLYSVTINYNKLNFATLPEPQPTWGEYFYNEQAIPVERSRAVGSELDLSSKVLRAGTETTAKVMVKAVSGTDTELDASKYSYANGKISFNEAISDSIYVVYSNTLLNEYSLSTTRFVVKDADQLGKPIEMVSFSTTKDTPVALSLGVSGATAANPVKVYVDYGDGTPVEYTVTDSKLPASANATGTAAGTGKVTISVEDNCALSAFAMDGVAVSSIDLSKATELAYLSLTNCSIRIIDLGYNRCLQSLDLSNNRISNLDLSGTYASIEKTVLTDINVSNNQLRSLVIAMTRSVKNLNASNNKLTEFDMTNFDNVQTLDMSNNELTGEFSLTYVLEATKINLSNNAITSVLYDTLDYLTDFDLSNNNLSLETLPYFTTVSNYTYAPQKPLELVPSAPAINISAQNRIIDGKGTTFVWKNEAGETLVQGVDVDCVNGGTRFLKEDLGKVYCEMTNPAFPQFTGANIYKTTLLNVVGKPTKVVATFTTPEAVDNGFLSLTGHIKGSIYIDWRGDQTEYLPYEFKAKGNNPNNADYTIYENIETYANAKVTVYTYDSETDLAVFSIDNVKMSDFDGSAMTALTFIGVSNAGLSADKMKLPAAPITELSLGGNLLTDLKVAENYPNLIMLNLQDNKFKTIDVSALKKLQVLYLAGNELTSIKFNNPQLWHLGIENNNFESIDLSGLPVLSQFIAMGNKFSTIDVSPVKNTLNILNLNDNCFTFATLPLPKDLPAINRYYYSNQALIEPIVSDDYMSFDLSSQAVIDGVESEYIWYLGQPEYDAESGEISGEVLYIDEEYDLKDGVTTFKTKFNDMVVCVITNTTFPSAFLMTSPYNVGYAGIDTVEAEGPKTVDVYTVYGMRVKAGVSEEEAYEGLTPGIYIVGGKKVYVK
ncbi:MAG: leucine-rich repeat domain-containing protein [Bacteroidales bacterium]|nr:leucine-rich repeat domain-containing protein [Bacteroidales bacterium]